MARYIGPVCKLCRAERQKLFLKGARCFTSKCAIERRNYGPGEHGRRRAKFSEYGIRLREKQKAKRIYGVLERQFRRYFEKASRKKGVTGSNLLVSLERRLDTVVLKLGFARSRAHARQVVRHGFIRVNGKKITIPSYPLKEGDVISINPRKMSAEFLKDAMDLAQGRSIPSWLSIDREKMEGVVNSMPSREDITEPLEEQAIVELYSK